jgi:hypothetical protein
MTDHADTLQTILSDADEMLREKFRALGLADTPFVMVAITQDNQMIVRGNLDPVALKLLSEDLAEVAEEASKRPANDD